MVRSRSAVRFREWAPEMFVGASFNGRTAVSKPANEGSIPSAPANKKTKKVNLNKLTLLKKTYRGPQSPGLPHRKVNRRLDQVSYLFQASNRSHDLIVGNINLLSPEYCIYFRNSQRLGGTKNNFMYTVLTFFLLHYLPPFPKHLT